MPATNDEGAIFFEGDYFEVEEVRFLLEGGLHNKFVVGHGIRKCLCGITMLLLEKRRTWRICESCRELLSVLEGVEDE